MATADPSSALSSHITPQEGENALRRSPSTTSKDLGESKAELLTGLQSLRKEGENALRGSPSTTSKDLSESKAEILTGPQSLIKEDENALRRSPSTTSKDLSESAAELLTGLQSLRKEDENALRRSPSTTSKVLNKSKTELLARLQSLRKDLRDWSGSRDNLEQTYKQELGDLRNKLDVEVKQLQTDCQELRMSLKKQLDVTAKIIDMVIPDKLPSSIEFTNEDNTVKYVDTIIKKDAKEDAEDSMDESAPPL